MKSTLCDYFDQMQAAFQQLELAHLVTKRRVNVAEHCVELRFGGAGMPAALWPALAHMETIDLIDAQACLSGDITFCIWDASTTETWPPRPPFTKTDYHRYGQRAFSDDGERLLLYSPENQMLYAYDRSARTGYFWVNNAAKLSIYDRAAPLQVLFHWALSEYGWQVLHGAAVGGASGGVLLAGSSGTGKSTTVLACLQYAGLRYLCDDKCLASLEPAPRVFGIFSAAKIKRDMLEALPHFRPLVAGWDHHFKADKGLVYLHPAYQDHMAISFPIRAILLVRITHQERPSIHPAGPKDAFKALGPSTVIWLPGAEAAVFKFMTAFVNQIPCYWLDLALDPKDNIQQIVKVIEGRI